MNCRIAIPSYKRAARLRDSTLALLFKHHVPGECIDVFVADVSEQAIYASTLDPLSYGRLIVAVPGMGAVRNFMSDFYEEGEPVLFIDDDITDFLTKDAEPLNFCTFVEKGFTECAAAGLRLWGIYPVANRYFMRDRATDGLTYIVGCFYGVFNNRSLHVTLDDKEDFERTILYYDTDGGVLRYGGVAPITRYYKTPGGMQETRSIARILASAQTLFDRYPQYCRMNLTKKSGHAEVRLLRLKRRAKVETATAGISPSSV